MKTKIHSPSLCKDTLADNWNIERKIIKAIYVDCPIVSVISLTVVTNPTICLL